MHVFYIVNAIGANLNCIIPKNRRTPGLNIAELSAFEKSHEAGFGAGLIVLVFLDFLISSASMPQKKSSPG